MNSTQTSTAGSEFQGATRSASAMARAASGSMAEPGTAPKLLSPLEAVKPGDPLVSTHKPLSRPWSGQPSGRHDLRLAIGGIVFLIVLVYLSARYVTYARGWVKTDNAYIAAHIHSISSRVAGTVKEVLVEENQTVVTCAVLARLDARDFEVRRQQALAQVAQAKAQSLEAEARIAQARAEVAREEARSIKAKKDLLRADSLSGQGSGAISKQDLDLAQANAQAAEAAVHGAASALESVTALAAATRAMEQAAQTNLRDAELQLSYTEILAPAAGRIGKKNLETGNHVQPGQIVLALVETEAWVTANFKETQLTRLKPGQAVQLRVDALPGQVFRGTVESLSPGSGAQFALLPPDNATGNFMKIVQRVPVKIALDRASLGDFEGRLVPGMSAVVEVKVND